MIGVGLAIIVTWTTRTLSKSTRSDITHCCFEEYNVLIIYILKLENFP